MMRIRRGLGASRKRDLEVDFHAENPAANPLLIQLLLARLEDHFTNPTCAL